MIAAEKRDVEVEEDAAPVLRPMKVRYRFAA